MNRILTPALAMLALLAAGNARADVPTVRVESRPLAPVVVTEATIEAVRESTVAAQAAGRIIELAVDAGDRVHKGQLVLRIDAAEAADAVAGAEAVVAAAETALANARAEHERARGLVERAFLSQSALDAARARFQAAEAQLRVARATRGQAATVQGYAIVTSPIDGVVAARHVEAGEMAQPGRELVTIYDPTALRAVADLSPQRMAELGPGVPRARVELPDSGRSIDAVAVTLLPAADARTHTVRGRVDLPDGTAGVLPGSFARVHFFGAEGVAAAGVRLVVPVGAVLRRGELTAVYVADGQGGFKLRQVRLGRVADGGDVEVLAGLAAGDSVALDPVQAGIEARAAASRER